MSDRTIKVAFYTYSPEPGISRVAYRGDTVDLSDEEVERGEALGAFEGSDDSTPSSLEGAFGSGDAPDGNPPPDDAEELKGDELDAAVAEAGIDASEGGSLSDGSMSADEKRAALKAAREG